ncbi:cation-transporting P-type ATPase [Polyangium spumosum]|uniref:HAD-IC family P-type ATPase n=1 Tax=Polyangium spumosum TaxID=889282 RepID=A0A6N7Q2W7_9BACT|nr:cation-transporting P-type ATPase [Polyangium spumosum]MRG96624.1 HAD-IC family P-type ATPase [Polyangium spumosum]
MDGHDGRVRLEGSGRDVHARPADVIVAELDSHATSGLGADEARRRLATHGPNALTPRRKQSTLARLLLQFHQPLIYLLLAAGAVTFALGERVDAGVIFGVVLVNAIVGFVQESKAVSAIEALARSMRVEATVLRDGEPRRISAPEIVPGDIVLLQSGDKVPADLRLARARDLQIDESALTGESVPASKDTRALAPETLLADRANMAYASTLVTHGTAKGVVVATGDHTEVGKISELISAVEKLETPLSRNIARISRLLLGALLLLGAVTVFMGTFLRGQALAETFMAAVALCVAAIPEGLPAAVTIILAIGVSRMARRRAIIRKLPAVETLGSTTVICSDKTGTLTENQMTVRRILAGGEMYEVSGAGYAPEGRITRRGDTVGPGEANRALDEALRCGLLCNDARVVEKAGRWSVDGDPTEGALLVAAHKLGLRRDQLAEASPRIDVLPFESEQQYMATMHDAGPGEPRVVYLKGAVERTLSRCVNALGPDGAAIDLDEAQVLRDASDLSRTGLRVLALARKTLPAETRDLEHAHVEEGLLFLGVQGMIDPPRPEAIRAVADCKRAGIQVKMITGDHAMTASAIAREIGLEGETAEDGTLRAVTGGDITRLDSAGLSDVAERVAVFARVTPEQKLRLVQALQQKSHVVAMTGDGVNDAPALRQSNIGVAMGLSGTDAAKEAADMVLTDDNFASIRAAVEEGRGVFDNLTKFIAWTLPTNMGEALVILLAIALGTQLPILPVQILWINMTTAVLLGMMLAFEPLEPETMSRPPRDPSAPILSFPLFMRMGLVSLLMLASAYGLFTWMQWQGYPLAASTTAAVNVFVVIEVFYLFNCRSLAHSAFHVGFFSNRPLLFGVLGMLALQLVFTYAPFMNRWFHSAPLGWREWLLIFASGVLVWGVVGFEKWVRRRTGRVVGHRAMDI